MQNAGSLAPINAHVIHPIRIDIHSGLFIRNKARLVLGFLSY